ncbi:MAG TPA: PilW family protein [Steroidobacteraceae bacterium]|nr:PilW family protein [Steroidobacteraceae bacterium]
MIKHSQCVTVISQLGFSLVEVMIAMVIALFLLGGILTVEQNNHATFVNQNQIVQLQDSERMAMSMMADVIQAAGYVANPATNDAGSAAVFPANAPFSAQGQYITYDTTATGDSIVVRYYTNGGDGVINCNGSSNQNAAGTYQLYVNEFSIINGQLVCTMNNTQYTLVNGVTSMTILYGVNTQGIKGNGANADTYKKASQMTATDWGNVATVTVTLEFNNPLYSASQTAQKQTLKITRAIGVMTNLGYRI